MIVGVSNLSQTDFYKSLQRTLERLEEDGVDDESEQREAMWEKRKFALKLFLQNNKKAIEKSLFSEDEEDDDN